ncbi:MAG: dTDP-glucose 4,6-dehydratase, partial [Bacteroidia bacterium]
MNILITGGAGFIGSAVIRTLLATTGHHIINVDKLTYAGNLDSIPGAVTNSNYTLVQIDICDPAALNKVFQQHQPNIVMHLAAESHV